ncbi:MAG: hypothetical protein ACRDNZ_09180, partial [Streptosporangiaceae bacterium]
RGVGLSAFQHRLQTGRPGTLLRQPVVLGAHGALAFWPLAAAATVAAIELTLVLRERRHLASRQRGTPDLPPHAPSAR